MSLSTVIITKTGGLQEKQFDTNYDFQSLLVHFDQKLRNRGRGPLKLIGAYPSQNTLLLGWTSGRHTQINRHEFAPPYDTDLFYGDVVVVKLKDMEDIAVSSISKNEYNEMYNTLMGGFESLESSEDEYECDQKEQGDEEDPDYKPGNDDSDHEINSYDTYSDSEGEWDFDEEDSI